MKLNKSKMMWYRKDIAQRITHVRVTSGLTLKEFGRLFTSPVNAGVVKKWESGVNLPNDEHMIEIAQIGNISLPWLMYGPDFENFQNHILPDVFQKLEYLESELRKENISEIDALETSDVILEALETLKIDAWIKNNQTPPNTMASKYRLQQVMEIFLGNNPTKIEVMQFNNLFHQVTSFMTAKVEMPNTYEDNLEILDSLLWLSGNHPKDNYKNNEIFRNVIDADGLDAHISKVSNHLHDSIDIIANKLREKYSNKK